MAGMEEEESLFCVRSGRCGHSILSMAELPAMVVNFTPLLTSLQITCQIGTFFWEQPSHPRVV